MPWSEKLKRQVNLMGAWLMPGRVFYRHSTQVHVVVVHAPRTGDSEGFGRERLVGKESRKVEHWQNE
jgi:hypothetical protein